MIEPSILVGKTEILLSYLHITLFRVLCPLDFLSDDWLSAWNEMPGFESRSQRVLKTSRHEDKFQVAKQ